MTPSRKAEALFGVSVDTFSVGALIMDTAGGGGGGGDRCDGEGEPYSAEFERRAAADGSRTRGKSAMSSKRDAAASKLNKCISWVH